MCVIFVSSAPLLSQITQINAFYMLLPPSDAPIAYAVIQTLYPIGYLLKCSSLTCYTPNVFQMIKINA